MDKSFGYRIETEGYEPSEPPIELRAILTFGNKTGRTCQFEVSECVAAFLDLDNAGFIPEISKPWRSQFNLDGRPQQTGCARYVGLRPHPNGICERCEAECHAIFDTPQERILIERWGITTAIMTLIRKDMLPTLPFEWYESLGRHYGRICETGRHNGHCPECSTAMSLVKIDRPEPELTPNGRRRFKAVDGIAQSLGEILERVSPASRLESIEDDITVLTPEGVENREFLVENFNLVASMFAETTGIAPSKALLLRMLHLFLEHRWYRWPTVNKGNLPWTFARLTCNFNLHRQRVRTNSAVWAAIKQRIPQAVNWRDERLKSCDHRRIYLEFGLKQHKVRTTRNAPDRETISLHVLSTAPGDANSPPVFETTLPLDTAEFLRRVEHKTHPEGYELQLVQGAREVLADYLKRNPEARHVRTEEAQ